MRRVLVQADDRAGVDPGRAQEPVAVLLRPRQRPLVRQDAAPGPERLEAQPGEEAALRPLDVRAAARGRSARRRRRRAAGPCGASRRSATWRASARRAGTGRPGRHPGSDSGRSRRTTFFGWRARSCRWSSGPMTSYGGATISPGRRRRPDRSAGRGRADVGHGFLGGAGDGRDARATRAGDLGSLHRTIGAVARPLRASDRARDRGPATGCNFSGGPHVDAPTIHPSLRPRSPGAPPPVTSRARAHRASPRGRSSCSRCCRPSRRAAAASGDGLTMTARALLQGHVRAGSWFAIAIDVENAGPTVTGELRIAGGADSRTRFGTPASSPRAPASSTSCTPCRPASAAR